MTTAAAVGAVPYPLGSPCDLLFVDAALPASSLGAWLQPDGSWGSYATARVFDLRPYRSVAITMSATALVGGTTPTIQPVIVSLDYPEPTVANAKGEAQGTPTGTIGASGGTQQIQAGDANAVAVAGGSYGGTPLIIPVRLVAAKLGVGASGSPDSITNGRFFFWGFRH